MVCPGALAMIGVYGSMLTGDVHEKSDLDLLIVINDAIFPDYLVEYEKPASRSIPIKTWIPSLRTTWIKDNDVRNDEAVHPPIAFKYLMLIIK